MVEAKATSCFCGCGTRVKNPRLVVTNTNGWELADELAQWAKVEFLMQSIEQPLAYDLADNIEQGQMLWLKLSDAIHAGERADRQDEMVAAVWRKHAKKARKKLKRSLRRDGLPNPFEFPTWAPASLLPGSLKIASLSGLANPPSKSPGPSIETRERIRAQGPWVGTSRRIRRAIGMRRRPLPRSPRTWTR